MTVQELARQTLNVLALQREYFQTRSQTKLAECRDAERRLKRGLRDDSEAAGDVQRLAVRQGVAMDVKHPMLRRPLYEACPGCRGTGQIHDVLIGGVHHDTHDCPLCKPARVVELGLTLGQLERMQAKADRLDQLANWLRSPGGSPEPDQSDLFLLAGMITGLAFRAPPEAFESAAKDPKLTATNAKLLGIVAEFRRELDLR